MRIRDFISIAFISAFGLISCSKDNVTSEEVKEQEKSEFRKLATMDIAAIEGNNIEIPNSRTISSVNGEEKPTEKYYKNYVNLLSLEVSDDINSSWENKDTNFNFKKETKQFVRHEFTNGNYDIYYTLSDIKDNGSDASLSGTITLATDKNNTDIEKKTAINIKLTVFETAELEKLKDKGDFISGLQNFYYSDNNLKPMGNVLYYLTYDIEDEAKSLPIVSDEKYSWLKDDTHQILYNESPDDYYVSNEILIAATEQYIYILETIRDNADTGYKLLRRYDREETDDKPVHRIYIEMSRLTCIINASLVINDTHSNSSNGSYYDDSNLDNSYNNFMELYKVNLRNMSCPYATIDGVPTIYDINKREENNTSGNGRLILWAEELEVVGIDGKRYERIPEPGKVYMVSASSLYSGLGFPGQSFSVCYKGTIKNGSLLQFYTIIDGVNLLISTKMELKDNLLRQNYTNQFTLLVDAKTLADTIIKMKEQQASGASRANSNDFVELRVPSENLIIN